jgi:hypothetical protein
MTRSMRITRDSASRKRKNKVPLELIKLPGRMGTSLQISISRTR